MTVCMCAGACVQVRARVRACWLQARSCTQGVESQPQGKLRGRLPVTSRSGRCAGSSACIWPSSASRSRLSLGAGSATYSSAALSVAPSE